LASVEIIEVSSSTATPVEKKNKNKKLKNKKRNKRQFKKNKKKPNRPTDYIKIGLLFNLIGTASLSAIALIAGLLSIGSVFLALFLIFALVATFFSLIFLMVFFLYISPKKRKRNKKIILKKPEDVLRSEVTYLSPKKVDLYLSLNEELTAVRIQQNVLIASKEDKNNKEWADTKLEIKDLETKINHLKGELKELRRQNKAMKVISERD
jgi:hypothetical protein